MRILGKVESEAQSVVADIRIYEGILMNVPAVIYCFLAGDNNKKITYIRIKVARCKGYKLVWAQLQKSKEHPGLKQPYNFHWVWSSQVPLLTRSGVKIDSSVYLQVPGATQTGESC